LAVIYIVSDYRGTYHYLVDRLREEGAELIELDPDRGLDRTISKFGILRQMMTPRLMGLRKRWTGEDTVLVISWYLIPVLVLIRLQLVPRPLRLVSMAAFVHDERLRRAVNRLLRMLRTDGIEFIAFSDAERRNLMENVDVRSERVHRVVYRGNMLESALALSSQGDYIFTGGYSNRDYETFFAAVGSLKCNAVTVASALNGLADTPSNVELRLDIPWDEFERLIAGCALLVLPLREGGEACGQNVLFRGIRHNRPVVATRHDSLIDYLGQDYPGFVPAGDPVALRQAIERALHDQEFRGSLVERIEATSRWFGEQERVEVEIVGILTQ
jgi:glycosyltransferase involved in cell wall biosynthesis